jgi:nucleotide-binding universal stress UspA family protein
VKHDAEIIILHVVEAGHPISYAGGLVESTLKRAMKKEKETDLLQMKKGIERFCQGMSEKTGHPCVELVSKIVVSVGYPVEEILNTVESEKCDAIVLGTHAKGFLKHAFLGSVAVSVLERTKKPVFIIPVPSETIAAKWGNV